MSSGRGQALWNSAQQQLEQLADIREGRVQAVFVFELVCCWFLDLYLYANLILYAQQQYEHD